MASVSDILAQLESKASRRNVAGMARFGISTEGRLGVSVEEMRRIARHAGKDHKAALELWKTGVAEARITASMIAVPNELTERQMNVWVKDFNSWDVCDQVCMNLFDKSPLARRTIIEWSTSEKEFVKRAAFALIACLASRDKQATDREFVKLLAVITAGATDERNFVKKAVNWALRNIGKSNVRLNQAAIRTARQLQRLGSRSARWIAADAIRELENPAVRGRIKS